MKRLLFSVLLLAAVIGWFVLPRGPKLPPVPKSGNFPEEFWVELKSRDAEAKKTATAESVRSLALLYQANSFLGEASQTWSALENLKVAPEPIDHYGRASLALAQGDLALAVEHLRRFTAALPSHLPGRLLLANALGKSGKPDEAAAEYEAILKLEPLQAQATVGMARIQLQRGEALQARRALERLVAANQEAVAAETMLVQLYSSAGLAEQAAAMAALARRHADVPPRDEFQNRLFQDCYEIQALSIRFETLLFSGRVADAAGLLKRLEALAPQSWLPPMLRAWAFSQAKEIERATEQFRLALDRGADAERLCPMAVAAFIGMGRPLQGLDFAERELGKLPRSLPVLQACARAAEAAQRTSVCLDYWRRALVVSPLDYEANLGLARHHWEQRELGEARPYLENLVRAFPMDVTSRALLAQDCLARGDFLRAAALSKEALAATVGATEARQALEALLSRASLEGAEKATAQKAWAEARVFIENLIDLDPANASLFLTQGDLFYRQGDLAGAKGAWSKGLALAGAEPELNRELGNRLAGHVDEASLP